MSIIKVPARDVKKMLVLKRCNNDVRVLRQSGGTKYDQIICSRSAAVRGGDWDLVVEETGTHILITTIHDVLVAKNQSWEDTKYFLRRMKSIRRGKRYYRGCQNRQDMLERCAEIERLYKAIDNSGYKTQKELGYPNPKDHLDDVRVVIGRHGEIILLDGRHRLAIAWNLNLTIPVRVVLRHKQWDNFRNKVHAHASRGKKHVYQKLDHPDLQSVNFAHGDERWPLIEPALRGYQGPALDLGAHWGHYSQKLAQLGIKTTAVEENRSCCEFARDLSRMPHSAFKVICGDLCETPDPATYRIVLALNIFHHFHKTQAGYERLEKFLRRLRPDVVIFEGHVQKPNGQMKNAYRDLAPQQFAAWVGTRVGLSRIERLGKAADGRSLFKLS